MSNEVVKSAARLRRSAIAERIRLREEWLALKETNNDNGIRKSKVLVKKAQNIVKSDDNFTNKYVVHNRENITGFQVNEVLRGVVVFVDVGTETRALALRAALMALGASVMPAWSPLVTHVVWSQGGCTKTRSKARALACRLVSPLWVESCAASARRLPEKMFPALTRPSDLPSPATLKKMLKKIDQENIPLNILENEEERPRLRMSSDSNRTDTSHDTTHDTSHDKSDDRTKRDTNIENTVNTKRRQVKSVTSEIAKKSRRKLFTQKEAELVTSGDETDEQTPRKSKKMTQENKKKLARAERTARKLVGTQKIVKPVKDNIPRIVLTGMSNKQRQEMFSSIHKLNGIIQRQVNRRTTHVILGSSRDTDKQNQPTDICNPERALEEMFRDIIVTEGDISGIDLLDTPNEQEAQCCHNESNIANKEVPRTVNALLGAVRGCRVLHEQWVVNSVKCNKWLPHFGYEVPHLLKISQKARIERLALEKINSEYAYDVFNGMRVRVSEHADKMDAVTQLLTLCGAVTEDGGKKQNGATQTVNKTQRSQKVQKVQNTQTEETIEITIGRNIGEVSSRWVFDSITAARPRTTRRYINK